MDRVWIFLAGMLAALLIEAAAVTIWVAAITSLIEDEPEEDEYGDV